MFITLEGIDGSGKTTQIKYIVDFLQSIGKKCVATREPGGTTIGEKIRAILLTQSSEDLDYMAELLLFTADRCQHIKIKIIPAINDGKFVICDRYFDATLAYQGYARGIDKKLIEKLHSLINKNLKPDLTFLFDIPEKLGLARALKQINKGAKTKYETKFEHEKIEFHKKVRAGYLKIAKKKPETFYIVDASKDILSVRQEIIMFLKKRLN
mmetsp:Transcript_6093/g.3440  ORF Transcript_6093/g.3440 Transcript_6093/m.3440 type:complete len:211 (+) Transcript_6093:31-663(+)